MVASKALKALACCCQGLASEMWRVGVVFVCVCVGSGGRLGRRGGTPYRCSGLQESQWDIARAPGLGCDAEWG